MILQVLGEYNYVVAVNPRQPVRRLSVIVHIAEESEIGFITVPPIDTQQSYTKDEHTAAKSVQITRGYVKV